MRRRRGRGQRIELVHNSEVLRHSRCPLYLIVWALGKSAAQHGRHQFATPTPLLVSPGEMSCAAGVQAWFTGKDAGILHGGQSEIFPSPRWLTSRYPTRDVPSEVENDSVLLCEAVMQCDLMY